MITSLEYWYDRNTKSWVIQYKDASGNQVGDAEYQHSKPTAEELLEICGRLGIRLVKS